MTLLLCECGSFLCGEQIEIVDALDLHSRGLVLLSDNCKRGPEPTDRLVEQRDGYALYRDLTNDR